MEIPRRSDDELNEAINELALTTMHSRDTLTAIARAYPDASFLRFVVDAWASGVHLGTSHLAEVFFVPENRSTL